MWSYYNPVRIEFGAGKFESVADILQGRSYVIVTYPDDPFVELSNRLINSAGTPALVINDIAPNPDCDLLNEQCQRFTNLTANADAIIALGGGSVIDSAKVFAAANGDFHKVLHFLKHREGGKTLGHTPIIAIPTTAGTGSEVTCWATVWDTKSARKYSLARTNLYPQTAVIDPCLMLGKSYNLTLATGLDALSHALESIWNINANPVSASHAVTASRTILQNLPRLLTDLGNIELRSSIAQASTFAGLAFSNTKTAIAHNLSYPITLGYGIQHGIACSFTLPVILQCVIGMGGFREMSLKQIFGDDLEKGAEVLKEFLTSLGIHQRFSDYGVPAATCRTIIDEAFAGERGKNFIGTKESFLNAAYGLGAINQDAT